MKHLTTYENYNTRNPFEIPVINEKYGIPNDLKELFEICYKDISNNILNKISTPIYISYDGKIKVDNLTFFIIDDNTREKIYGNTNSGKFYNNILKFSIITLYFDFENYDMVDLKRIILHELLHLYEFYMRFENNVISKLQYDLGYEINILSDKFKNDKFISDFIYLIYISLDHEINARVSETYIVLMEDRILNSLDVMINLKKTKAWKHSLELLFFVNFINDNNSKIDYDNLFDFFSILNPIMNRYSKQKFNLYNIPKDKNDCVKLIKEWKVLFKKKALYFQDKLIKLIDEVVNDINMINSAYVVENEKYELFVSEGFRFNTHFNTYLERKSKIFKILRE